MYIKVKKDSSWPFHVLIDAAIINCSVTSNVKETKTSYFYYHFDMGNGKLTVKRVYNYALACIKYDFMKEEFKHKVSLIDRPFEDESCR